MINHARTLLLNVAPPYDPNCLGDEIVDPGFRPVSLPDELLRLRRVLFGSTPDREMLNYRGSQLLQLLNCLPPLQAFVTRFDSRLTYDFARDTATYQDPSLFLPQVQALQGQADQVTVVGEPDAPDASGRLRHDYLLSVEAGSLVDRQAGLAELLVVTAGLSQPVRLPGLTREVLIQQPTNGQTWRVTVRDRPRVDLGQLLVLVEQLGGETLNRLFRTTQPVSRQEPWSTFRNLFYQHYDLPHRLGGIVLTLIYRTEEVRLA